MDQGIVRRLTPICLAFGLALGSAGAASAADWATTRTYSYVAPVYDDVPGPLAEPVVHETVYGYEPVVERPRIYNYVAPAPVVRRPVYGYRPVVERPRVYNYVAPAPVVRRPAYGYRPVVERPRVYNYVAPAPVVRRYGPDYGYVASETVIVERENRPLGVYAPLTREHLSEPRRYFRAITRQSGGN
jgi:hypothetical protein